MQISTDMMVRIAHADLALHMAFPRTIDRWQRDEAGARPWKVEAGNCPAVVPGKNEGIIIDGNCSSGVSAPDGGIVHIYGDLGSRIDASGHYEIVITGDVLPDARIEASGFCDIFVGGRFSGELCSADSTKLWIDSDFDGTVRTGNPSTELHIGGDCTGTIVPSETGALLWLSVGGFASDALLSAIVKCEYTQFNASIARSDVPPGIYPEKGHRKKSSGKNSFNRWCVRSQHRT